jgi:hypothetical protein
MFCAGLLLATPLLTGAQTLYNGSLDTLPENQGWTYAALGSATETLTGNTVMLDTTASTSTEAGWSEVSPEDLNRTNGFTLQFTLQMNSETHTSTNRSGFSIIVLGDDKSGIELSFWTNTIFAESDSPLFTQAENVSFVTTGSLISYNLTLLATSYILTANGATILSGPIRNYTAFSGFPDPYSTPDFLFFGDNTSSASASFNVGALTLIFPPQLTITAPSVISWTGVSNETYTVQSSTNLTTWSGAGTATSQNNSFAFTNSASPAKQFFRVVAP